MLTELLIFCSNFVLGPFILLWFFSNLILIFCLLCNEYALFILLCMFNFQIFFFFFWVGSIMVLWWDLSFVVIGFVMVWCVVESINQTHQTLVLCHLICKCSLPSDFGSLPFDLSFGFNHLYLLSGYKNKENFFASVVRF